MKFSADDRNRYTTAVSVLLITRGVIYNRDIHPQK